jgi:hypothetical protein
VAARPTGFVNHIFVGNGMSQDMEGQAGEKYRCVMLPSGMTRACLDELASLINEHQFDECDDLDVECAVKAFLIVQSHLR